LLGFLQNFVGTMLSVMALLLPAWRQSFARISGWQHSCRTSAPPQSQLGISLADLHT
jgi:hypothetical protein